MATEFGRGTRRGMYEESSRRDHHHAARVVWAITRIILGLIFLWAFLDKLFGLGFATPAERAWLNGGSPTRGFLSNVDGPFTGAFTLLAGNVAIDWLFMIGLLGIGLALVIGIGLRIAAVAGATMLLLMWAASLPLETHPLLDDHIVYAVVLIGLAFERAGQTWGLGRWWASTPLVERARWLE